MKLNRLVFLILLTAIVMPSQLFGQILPPAGKGKIYLLRPPNFVGSGLKTDYKCNGVDVGALQNKSFIEIIVEPGGYEIQAQFKGQEQISRVTVQAQPDAITYVQQNTKMVNGTNFEILLEEVSQSKTSPYFAKLKLSKFATQTQVITPKAEATSVAEPVASSPTPAAQPAAAPAPVAAAPKPVSNGIPAGWKTHTNSVYSISYPGNWQVSITPEANMISLNTLSADSKTAVSINTYSMDGSFLDMNTFFNTLVDSYAQTGATFLEKRKGIRGNDARIVFVNNGMRTIQYLKKAKGQMFIFTAASQEAGFAQFAQTVSAIEQSLVPRGVKANVQLDPSSAPVASHSSVPADWKKYDNGVFSVQHPASWIGKANTEAKTYTMNTKAGDVSLSVTTQVIPGAAIEMGSYYQSMVDIYTNMGVDFKEKKQNIRGNDALFAYVSSGVRTEQYILKHGDQLYLFTAAVQESDYSTFAADIKLAEQTFVPNGVPVKIAAPAVQTNAYASTSTGSTQSTTSYAPVASNKRAEQEPLFNQLYSFRSNASGSSSSGASGSALLQLPKTEKLKKVAEDFPKLKYRRSSLYTLMIDDASRDYHDVIRNAFGNAEIPEKFNDHNVGPYLIPGNGGQKDQSYTITNYVNTNQLAKKMVARWFNRDENGGFNMDLIAERGQYNASEMDVAIAGQSQRGTALLADAGEELIKNTFLIVNDYKYTNKEEVAAKSSKWIALAGELTGQQDLANMINTGAAVAGKGYIIKSTTYLYKLVWNEEVAAQFYSQFWTDQKNPDPAKVAAFEKTDLFKLQLVGSQSAWSDVQSSAFTNKSDAELIERATVKSTDKAIAKLQIKYPEFQTKTPLTSVNPLAAKIGMKEGLKGREKFEVLEQVIDKDGKTSYRRKSIIYVDKRQIWDNRYMASEENPTPAGKDRTLFRGSAAGLYPGMLIRQIK